MRPTTREHVELLHDAVTAAHVACVVNGETHGSPDPVTFRIWLFGAQHDPADAVAVLVRRIAAHPPAEQVTPKFRRLLDRMEELAEVWPWTMVEP